MTMKNAVGVRLVAFLMGAMATLSFLVINSVYNSFMWKSHTHEVKEKIEKIVGLSIEAQTSVRGFLISKNRDFLVGYHQVSPMIMGEVRQLKFLTEDNRVQQLNCTQLEILMSNTLSTVGRTLALADTDNFKEAEKAIASGEGEKLMRKIKELTGKMLDVENQLLVEREAAVDRSYTYAYYGMPALVILSAVVVACTGDVFGKV